MGPPKKLLLIISTLEGGGAERVMTYLLRHLDRRVAQPILVLLKGEIAYGQDIPTGIRLVALTQGSLYNLPKLIRGLIRVMAREKPDLVLSFLTYANWLTILTHRLSRREMPLVISERNHLSQSLAHVRLGGLKKWLTRVLYRQPDRIICISQGLKDDLTSHFGVEPDRVSVIHNPCDLELVRVKGRERVEHPWFGEDVPVFVAMGRLTRQKNYPLLLKALALVLRGMPLKLMILGQGEERQHLEGLVRELGLTESVAFLGFQTNPFAYLGRARGLVLSSSWEGFANVLVEAMALSVPVVATRCPSGPGEIITHGVDGLLAPVDDPPALAAAMTVLATDEALASRLGAAGRGRAEDFRVERMVRRYEQIIAGARQAQAGEMAPKIGAGRLRPPESKGKVCP